MRRAVLAVAALVLTVAPLAACSTDSTEPGAEPGRVAFLLPESKTSRYESFDRPYFEERFKELCAQCKVVYANADGDAAKQQQQAESALTQNISVLVLDPVDSAAAASIVASAKSRGIAVIAYDRIITNADLDYFISFDSATVGSLQGTALVEKLTADGKPDGNILMINGSPTDSNAAVFKAGAHAVIDASQLNVIAEYDTPDWSPDKAQEWASGQVVQHAGEIDGIYAANDGTAGGVIAALKAAGVDPLPPVTGQDGELTAVQRIISGDQYMTVYKAAPIQATAAAEVAFALMTGGEVAADDMVDGVPSMLLDPVAVTRDNIADTIIADGYYLVADICTPEYAAACATAGIE